MSKKSEGILMKTSERLAIIVEIAKRNPNVGKTGVMKYLYLLQVVYQVPLAYDFEIYTYGPYCQTVMSDIEYAEFADYIEISSITYPNGMNGYHINVGNNSEQICNANANLLFQYSDSINQIIEFLGEKTAKELELYSTTVFVTLSFKDNCWDGTKKEICQAVRKIKPHFSEKTISAAFDDLVDHHFLNL